MKDGVDDWVGSFVEDLSAVPSGPRFTNFYSASDDLSGIRRHNLSRYLHQAHRHNPRVILVGEAPGYRGTRVTGVPFADVRALTNGVPTLSMLGLSRGYRVPPGQENPPFEQTSTIVWEALARHKFVPLLWAAFPFHPYAEDESSNRAPRSPELELGRDFLYRLIDGWRIDRVIAVGGVAERTLRKSGIDAERIRHPSRGGKREFNLGLERIVNGERSLRRFRTP